ncbi:hypothetical protein Ciccas_013816, partial [Cichlidogyrus casuarinus]
MVAGIPVLQLEEDIANLSSVLSSFLPSCDRLSVTPPEYPVIFSDYAHWYDAYREKKKEQKLEDLKASSTTYCKLQAKIFEFVKEYSSLPMKLHLFEDKVIPKMAELHPTLCTERVRLAFSNCYDVAAQFFFMFTHELVEHCWIEDEVVFSCPCKIFAHHLIDSNNFIYTLINFAHHTREQEDCYDRLHKSIDPTTNLGFNDGKIDRFLLTDDELVKHKLLPLSSMLNLFLSRLCYGDSHMKNLSELYEKLKDEEYGLMVCDRASHHECIEIFKKVSNKWADGCQTANMIIGQNYEKKQLAKSLVECRIPVPLEHL